MLLDKKKASTTKKQMQTSNVVRKYLEELNCIVILQFSIQKNKLPFEFYQFMFEMVFTWIH